MKYAVLALTLAAVPLAAPPALAADLDYSLLKTINGVNNPVLDDLNGLLSDRIFTAGAPVVLSLAASGGDLRVPLITLEAELAAFATSTLLKSVFRRPRPYLTHPQLRVPNGREDSPSFPSGHATVSFAAATVIADHFPSYAWASYGLAALVSYSRVYNGVHYPTDVLSGAVVGYGVGKATTYLHERTVDRWLGTTPQAPAAVSFRLSF